MGTEAGLATAMRARGDAELALKPRPFPRAGELAPGEARGGTGAHEVAAWPISASQEEPAVAARVRAGLGVHGDAQARQDQWAQGGGGRAPRPGALGGERAAGPPDAATPREAHGGHGAGASMEADVLVLLPVPAGHCALHAGALGANRVQYPVCPGLAGAWRGARAGLEGGGGGVLGSREVEPRRSGSCTQFPCPRWRHPDFCKQSGGRRLPWCFLVPLRPRLLLILQYSLRQGCCKSLRAWASLTLSYS